MPYAKTPWTLRELEDGADLYDADGFLIVDLGATAVLRDWEATGVMHWALRPGQTFVERPIEEILDTAKLLKAAPKLLEACKRAERELTTQHARELWDGGGSMTIDEATARAEREPRTVEELLRAAIAEAEAIQIPVPEETLP